MTDRHANVATIALVAIGIVSLCFGMLAACGTDVSLGGGGDAGATNPAGIDGAVKSAPDTFDCEPCSAASSCQEGSSCATIDGGDGFCLARCDAASRCESDETCNPSTDLQQHELLTCVPTGRGCPAAVGPAGPDGGTIEQCGLLAGPRIADAGCKDCRYECQRNGCYGGYYCNTNTRECVRPPAHCL